MAHALQLAEWDRTAQIVVRLHNAWFKDQITPRDANPLRAARQSQQPPDLSTIRKYFKPKAKP